VQKTATKNKNKEFISSSIDEMSGIHFFTNYPVRLVGKSNIV